MEAEAQFVAGNLEKASKHTKPRPALETNQSEIYLEAGRALAYMTASQTTDMEKKETLKKQSNC
jgi:hemolysin-activating ACP:hemolysin acyltransferase